MATSPSSPRARDAGALVRPRTIAAIGGSAAAEVIRQCRRMDFDGVIHPVHPHRDTVEGLPACRRVAELPAVPDAAFIGVNRHATIEVVRELSRMGAGGAVCFASGFRESGADGATLQDELIEAAGDMPLLGPNCYGFINYLDGALLWPDQHGGIRRESGVALLTQSSNIAINLSMNRRGLPIAYMITLGNQAVVGMSEMIRAVAADERVTAIGLLIEGFDDVDAFAGAIHQARSLQVPVVVMKAGMSDTGAELAMSHTASLGGSVNRVDALLQRLGVGRVDSLTALLETLKLLHAGGPVASREIVSLSCSGGEAILMADAGGRHGLAFPAFTPQQHQAVAATVSDLVQVSNPFDYHMFMWGDRPAMTRTFAEVMRAGFALTCLVLDLPRGDRCDDALWRPSMEALIDAHRQTGARAAMMTTMPEGLPEEVAEQCIAAGVVPLVGLDDAMTAIATAAAIGHNWRTASAADDWRPLRVGAAGVGEPRLLSETAAKARLKAAGVPVPEGREVEMTSGTDDAVAAADEIGFPLALKAAAPGLAHKTEAGAVLLNIRDRDELRRGLHRLAGIADTVLIERMVDDGVAEVLVGYERDPGLGGFLTLASGGILVELIGDSRTLALPAAAPDVRRALGDLRVSRLLAGYRGRVEGDLDALAEAIAAIGDFCVRHARTLVELDINPLIVRPRGQGVVAADALIRQTEGNGENGHD